MISFRCPTCDHLLKVSPEKAGKKVKCNRCESAATVPASADGELVPEAPAAPKPVEEEDDKKGYGLVVDAAAEAAAKRKREEEEKRAKKAKKDSSLPTLKKRVKTIYDAPQWSKVRIGFTMVMAALGFWGLQFVLHEVVVLVGIIRGPEYATVVDEALLLPIDDPDFPQPGQMRPNDRVRFGVALISGLGFVTMGRILFILGELFLLFMGGLFLVSYLLFFRAAPNRFGTHTQVKTLTILSCINLFAGLFFRFLPIIGLYKWPLYPLTMPEIAMNEGNVERGLPLHVFWLASPFWETTLCLILQLCFYLEPVMIGVFVWSCGKQLQDHRIEEDGQQVTNLGLGVYFIAFGYVMVSIAGTSEMLILILKVFYFLWMGFYIGYLIRFALVLNAAQNAIGKLIEDTREEERTSGKKKRVGKLKLDEDEDYEDEDEDEEDEDDDDEDDDDDDDDR